MQLLRCGSPHTAAPVRCASPDVSRAAASPAAGRTHTSRLRCRDHLLSTGRLVAAALPTAGRIHIHHGACPLAPFRSSRHFQRRLGSGSTTLGWPRSSGCSLAASSIPEPSRSASHPATLRVCLRLPHSQLELMAQLLRGHESCWGRERFISSRCTAAALGCSAGQIRIPAAVRVAVVEWPGRVLTRPCTLLPAALRASN